MKRFILLLLIAVLFNEAHSQDLIVTTKGDSINCKITKTTPENVYFTFNYNGSVRSTLLPHQAIRNKIKNYYSVAEIRPDQVIGKPDFEQVRLAFNLGPGFRLGKVDQSQTAAVQDYLKKLKSGFQFSADLSYNMTPSLGIGLQFSNFLSANSADNLLIYNPTGQIVTADVSDKISIMFIGPTITTRFFGRGNNDFFLSYGLGLVHYLDNAVMDGTYKITGNTAGLSLNASYDISLSGNVKLGLQMSVFTGYLQSVKVDSGGSVQTIQLEKGSYETLNRLDLSIGLRFYL